MSGIISWILHLGHSVLIGGNINHWIKTYIDSQQSLLRLGSYDVGTMFGKHFATSITSDVGFVLMLTQSQQTLQSSLLYLRHTME